MFEKQSQAVTVKQTLTNKCHGKNTCRFFWNAFAAAASSGLKGLIQLISLSFTSQPLEVNWRGRDVGERLTGKIKKAG